MTNNMTEGPITGQILRFCGPLFAGMIFQQFYTVADAAIVGRLLGSGALAAVGGTSPTTFMIIGFCTGLCSGFAIPVAQYFGCSDIRTLKKYVGGSVVLAAAFALVFTLATVYSCRSILTLMGTPADILDMTDAYLRIIFAAIPCTILYNLTGALLRSLGDSRTPLICLIISSVLNILLDLVLIMWFHMGVRGAAYATMMAQGISGLVCLFYIIRKCPILHITGEHLRSSGRTLGHLLAMGFPMGFQYAITGIGCMILQAAINDLGTIYVAGAASGVKLMNLLETPTGAMGITMATYCGQNAGAGRTDRISKGIRSAGLICCIYSLGGLVFSYFFGKQASMMFLKAEETEVIALSARYLLIQAVFLIPLSYVNVLRFSIQGMGFPGVSIISGVMELIGRVAAAWWLVPAVGFVGAALGSPIAWIAANIFLIPCCLISIKKTARAGNLAQA